MGFTIVLSLLAVAFALSLIALAARIGRRRSGGAPLPRNAFAVVAFSVPVALGLIAILVVRNAR